MDLTKYIATSPPQRDALRWSFNEYLKIERSIGSLEQVFEYLTTLQETPVWIAPVYQNGWVNYTPAIALGWEVGSYYKDPFGWVHIRGLITAGTTVGGSGTIFNLPSGFRPLQNVFFPAVQSDAGGATLSAVARLDIRSNGDVIVHNMQVNSGAGRWLSITGVRFHADGG